MACDSNLGCNMNIAVEIRPANGATALFVGKLVRRDEKFIVLTDAAWVADTGRRYLFFAGTPDGYCEVEPYSNGMEVELPADGAIVVTWPHPLFREAI